MKDLSSRDRYAALALSYVPHITQLVDRNPFSPTYGCFDREYWHYRTRDFPCGMSQEMCLPFALLFRNEYPGNCYHGWERMREIAVAGMRFACNSSHKDGTCDDYFPHEQAMGALVFSTYAITETYQMLECQDEKLLSFFRRRGDHLCLHNETGRLSNHQAFAALALYNIFLVTGNERYRQAAEERARLTLSWQHPEEGWFQEYEGADPGYHTCTIDFLAKLHQKSGWDFLLSPLSRAVDFAWYFIHPDGSYGGEYGSRNTYHFYPHGFELMAPHNPKAAQIADAFLLGLETGKRYHNDDDRMCAHTVYDWLQAYSDYCDDRPPALNTRPDFVQWMPGAGMAVAKKAGYYAVANLRKGGTYKVFNEDGCVTSDTGLVAELDNDTVVVTHLMDAANDITATPETAEFSVRGVFCRRRVKLFNPLKMIIFRMVNLTLGRFFPNLLRATVQKLFITGKPRTSFRFSRSLRFAPDCVEVKDILPDPIPLKRLSVSSDATSIYVANSNVYQESVLRCGWEHATDDQIREARAGNLQWTRTTPGREAR